jgi:hypothetical protein
VRPAELDRDESRRGCQNISALQFSRVNHFTSADSPVLKPRTRPGVGLGRTRPRAHLCGWVCGNWRYQCTRVLLVSNPAPVSART